MDRILLIGDAEELRGILPNYLREAGFRVDLSHDSVQAAALTLTDGPALFVVGTHGSGSQSGYELVQHLRTHGSIPIVLLTPGREDVDRILGLESGADDCLSIPFSPRELLARIHAVLRRMPAVECSRMPAHLPAVRVGTLVLEPASRVVRQGERLLDLTGAEFGLLEVLMRHVGRVVRREELADHILGRPGSPKHRSLDSHISRLRKKLQKVAGRCATIQTIRNVGYAYVLPQTSEKPNGAAEPGAV